jgi:cytoskeletal protein RodZ
MTSADSGSSRPGRVAGVALLGLAGVALIIGLVTVFGGNGDGSANETRPPRPPATSSSATSTSARPPSSTSTSVSAPTTTTTKTTTTTTVPPGDGNGEPAKSVPVRVLNNSKIKGLAAEAAADLKADGWQVTEVGNYSATNVATTTVYFRPGTEEEAAARALAADFGLPAEPRISGIQSQPAGVIVIVTSDYKAGSGGKNED